MISRTQRFFASVMALLFGLVIFGSIAVIAADSQHECTGEDCSVCELVQRCQQLVNTVGTPAVPAVSHFAVIFAMTAVLLCGRAVVQTSTLISLKVELLD